MSALPSGRMQEAPGRALIAGETKEQNPFALAVCVAGLGLADWETRILFEKSRKS